MPVGESDDTAVIRSVPFGSSSVCGPAVSRVGGRESSRPGRGDVRPRARYDTGRTRDAPRMRTRPQRRFARRYDKIPSTGMSFPPRELEHIPNFRHFRPRGARRRCETAPRTASAHARLPRGTRAARGGRWAGGIAPYARSDEPVGRRIDRRAEASQARQVSQTSQASQARQVSPAGLASHGSAVGAVSTVGGVSGVAALSALSALGSVGPGPVGPWSCRPSRAAQAMPAVRRADQRRGTVSGRSAGPPARNPARTVPGGTGGTGGTGCDQ